MKNIVILDWSRFPVKLLLLVVYLNLSLLSYNDLWNNDNLAENLLCNLFEYLQSFECYHMFFLYCLLVDQKASSINHDIVIFDFYIWIKKSVRDFLFAMFHSVYWGINPPPPLKNTTPLSCQAYLKSANCSSPILVFREPSKNRIFQWTPEILKSFIYNLILLCTLCVCKYFLFTLWKLGSSKISKYWFRACVVTFDSYSS